MNVKYPLQGNGRLTSDRGVRSIKGFKEFKEFKSVAAADGITADGRVGGAKLATGRGADETCQRHVPTFDITGRNRFRPIGEDDGRQAATNGLTIGRLAATNGPASGGGR